MYYIFSSARRDLYKRGVLETCSFPDNHVHRYRYSERLVPQDIQHSPERLLGQDCVIVYAYEGKLDNEFDFLPLRCGVIVECNMQSGFIFVDIKLGAFVDYVGSAGNSHLDSWKKAIEKHDDRPHPEGSIGGEGRFIYEASCLDGLFSERDREASWKGVIDALSVTPMSDCITYQVLGFFNVTGWRQRTAQTARAWLARLLSLPIFGPRVWSGSYVQNALRFLLRTSEKRIEPVVRGSDCWYPLPMGGTVLLRVIVYRPTPLPLGKTKTLVFDYDAKAFSSVSETSIPIESRYDDIRTLLSCARLVDPTFTTFSIRQESESGPDSIWAAEPTFVIRIGPPPFFLFITLGVFAFGLYCLNLPGALPISRAWLGYHPFLASVAKHPRPLGTLSVLYASWNYLRKFPLK